jgi:hypothetical protein
MLASRTRADRGALVVASSGNFTGQAPNVRIAQATALHFSGRRHGSSRASAPSAGGGTRQLRDAGVDAPAGPSSRPGIATASGNRRHPSGVGTPIAAIWSIASPPASESACSIRAC